MKAKEINKGAIVRLRSGGPSMTVLNKAFGQDALICQWFVNDSLEHGTFAADSLIVVQDDGSPKASGEGYDKSTDE